MVLYEEESKVDRGEIDSKDSFQTNVTTKLFIIASENNIIFQGLLFVKKIDKTVKLLEYLK